MLLALCSVVTVKGVIPILLLLEVAEVLGPGAWVGPALRAMEQSLKTFKNIFLLVLH